MVTEVAKGEWGDRHTGLSSALAPCAQRSQGHGGEAAAWRRVENPGGWGPGGSLGRICSRTLLGRVRRPAPVAGTGRFVAWWGKR